MRMLENDPNVAPSGFVDVDGYERLYAVNRYGDIFCYPKNRGLRGSTPAKLMKKSYTQYGYQRAYLRKDRKTHFVHAHRLVAQAFLPNPAELPLVHHKDNDKRNNKVDNLEWVSCSTNLKKAYYDGLNYVSAKQKNASVSKSRKLSYQQAEGIRRLYDSGKYTQRQLNEMFGGDIPRLLRGDSYKVEEYV